MESKYRVDMNRDQYPTVNTIVVQAADEIKKKSIYTLFVRHVLEFGPGYASIRGFMPSVVSEPFSVANGEVYRGEDNTAYEKAVQAGNTMLAEMIEELEQSLEATRHT